MKIKNILYIILILILNYVTLSANNYENEKPFYSIFSTTLNGDISATGSSVICADNNGKCNWNYKGYLFNINPKTLFDGDKKVFNLNSGTAKLNIPQNITGKDIVWAGLYWQGHIFGLGNHNKFLNSKKNINKVTLMDSKNNVYNITANSNDIYYYGYDNKSVYKHKEKGYRFFYQAYKNITNIIKNSYSYNQNSFTVGNIKTTLTKDKYYIKDKKTNSYVKWGNWGGWSIIVVYNDPTSNDTKNIDLFNGFKFLIPQFGTTASLTINLPQNSFYTPVYGTIKSKTIMFSAGAEKKIAAEKLEMYSNDMGYVTLSNKLNPADNQINDSITYLGKQINPNRIFNAGTDLDTYDSSGSLSNGQTTTSIKVTMTAGQHSSDQAFVGFIGLSNDIYKPNICYQETLYDQNNSRKITPDLKLSINDVITDRLIIRNKDKGVANNVKIFKDFNNTGFTYSNNSTYVKNILDNNLTLKTDLFNDDIVDYDNNLKKLIIRIGKNADSNNGGKVYPNNIAKINFNFKLNDTNNYKLKYNASYNFEIAGKHFNIKGNLPKCVDFNNVINVYKPVINNFNIVNKNFSGNVDPVDNLNHLNDLYTQVINEPFFIKGLSLDKDNSSLLKTTNVVFFEVVDANNINSIQTCKTAKTLYTNKNFFINFNKTSNNSKIIQIPIISKNASFRLKYINWNNAINKSNVQCTNVSNRNSNLPGVPACLDSEKKLNKVFPNNNCLNVQETGAPCKSKNHGVGTGKYNYQYGCAECLTDQESTKICSRDNFSIRPYSFRVFGENQYKLAGENFNTEIKAVDKINNNLNTGTVSNINGINDYNVTLNNLNIKSNFYKPSNSDINQMKTDTGTTNVITCPNNGTFTINNNNNNNLFKNGDINASLKFSETGILDLNVSEIPGKEWALVDKKDTPDSLRYIKPSTTIFDKNNINKTNLLLFIPYSFDTNATYKTTNNKNWLYMNDINISNSTFVTPKMASYINYTIIAKNKNGNITHNYTKTCFPDVDEVNAPRVNGLKLNTTFDLFLNADINSSSDANISLYTEDNNSSSIWTLEKNKFIVSGKNSIKEWISPLNFTSGIGKAKVYFNVDRNNSIAVNPIKINVIDVNTSTSWMTNPGSTKFFNGNDINKSIIFYYGRVHAPDYRGVTPISANIYYEIYDDNASNKSLYNINGKESIDSINWYINTLHGNIDGNVSNNGINSYKAVENTLINPKSTVNINNGIETITLTKNITMKDKIKMYSSKWLVFGNSNNTIKYNDFLVEFYKNGHWAGIGHLGRTVDLKISTVTNHRINW